MQKRIYLSSPTMHEEEMDYVKEAFERNWVAPLGFNCDGFENEIASFLNEENIHTLALSSGTAALHLAVKHAGETLYGKPAISHGALEGRRVFCSDMTFAATVNPVVYEKAEPVFIDTEYESWNMDPKCLEKAFSIYPNVKTVVVANL